MISVTGHRLLVKRFKLEERDETYRNAVKAGIVIPDNEDKKRAEAGVDRGEVIQTGPDCWKAFYLNANPADQNFQDFKPWCKKGDTVLFAKWSGKDYKDEKIDYLILNDEDIIAVIGE